MSQLGQRGRQQRTLGGKRITKVLSGQIQAHVGRWTRLKFIRMESSGMRVVHSIGCPLKGRIFLAAKSAIPREK